MYTSPHNSNNDQVADMYDVDDHIMFFFELMSLVPDSCVIFYRGQRRHLYPHSCGFLRDDYVIFYGVSRRHLHPYSYSSSYVHCNVELHQTNRF